MIGSKFRNLLARSVPQTLRCFVPESVYKHLYTQGVINVALKNDKSFHLWTHGYDLENKIFWGGIEKCHEPLSMRIWLEICTLIKPKEIWDIGANTGIYGIVAQIQSPVSNITFFEPLKECIRILEINLKLNGMKAVIHQVALANYVGTSKIALNSSQDFGYAAGLGVESLPGHRSVEVEVNVAKAYLNHSQNLPELVKCDVETFEPNVLEGFGRVDFLNTIFLIEILNEKVAGELQSFFDPADFEFVNIDDINSRFSRQEKLSPSFTYNFLIYPKSSSGPVNLLLNDLQLELDRPT